MALSEKSSSQRRIMRKIAGKEIITDMDGFIQNPSMWSAEVARVMAREIGIESLNEKQWRVLRFIRNYYLKEGKEPMNHKIKLGTSMSIKEIESLFPGGIARGARRLAGLPKPRGCAAGS